MNYGHNQKFLHSALNCFNWYQNINNILCILYLTKVEFEEERRQLLELAEYNEHSSEVLEEKLKENEQQLSEITTSLLQREDELQQMQEKLVSVAA